MIYSVPLLEKAVNKHAYVSLFLSDRYVAHYADLALGHLNRSTHSCLSLFSKFSTEESMSSADGEKPALKEHGWLVVSSFIHKGLWGM